MRHRIDPGEGVLKRAHQTDCSTPVFELAQCVQRVHIVIEKVGRFGP